MGMNIKDAEVHAMARRLAALRCTTVTDAVRQALQAELERAEEGPEARAVEARREELFSLLPGFRQLPWPDRRTSSELQSDLYDANGLPA